MLTYKSITHTGERAYNEDSAICLEEDGKFCFVVADGLGGHGKGEVASQKVTEVFEQEFRVNQNTSPKSNLHFLDHTFTKAQQEVVALQEAQGDTKSMKTTAVALSIMDGSCSWAHIGDSRLYIFAKNKVKLRTLDHSVPQMLVFSGEIKEKHIRTHPYRNRLMRVIGMHWDSPRYELGEVELPLEECQAFLLCTDGFWENITEKKMCKFLKKSSTVEEWLDLMLKEVEKNGLGNHMDNYTAIAVQN